ncbi:MAG TPA: hypothetical protein VFW49_15055 [Fluviicoccus sp.]|nr:hypothetical protein [Fluviicoccus sp.]
MKVPADYRYHCHDRKPPAPILILQDGWWSNETRRMVVAVDPMTKDCRYAANGYAANDPGCTGCKWLAGTGCQI